MFRTSKSLLSAAAFAALLVAAPAIAQADCNEDIDKVEAAVAGADRLDLDSGTVDQMRQLLDQANEALKGGDEAKCQELIDQAKSLGGVD